MGEFSLLVDHVHTCTQEMYVPLSEKCGALEDIDPDTFNLFVTCAGVLYATVSHCRYVGDPQYRNASLKGQFGAVGEVAMMDCHAFVLRGLAENREEQQRLGPVIERVPRPPEDEEEHGRQRLVRAVSDMGDVALVDALNRLMDDRTEDLDEHAFRNAMERLSDKDELSELLTALLGSWVTRNLFEENPVSDKDLLVSILGRFVVAIGSDWPGRTVYREVELQAREDDRMWDALFTRLAELGLGPHVEQNSGTGPEPKLPAVADTAYRRFHVEGDDSAR